MKTESGARTTTDGQPPSEDYLAAHKYHAPAPKPIDPATGQHGAYWVLTEEERHKGFVRPVRESYIHAGDRPNGPVRDLTEDERVQYARFGYVKFEEYQPNDGSAIGRFWTQAQLISGCGSRTTMGLAIAETYAREPKFYGATFCCHCRQHFPVDQFVWDGTTERVGS